MSHIGRRIMSIGMAGAALLATTAILSAQDPIRACAKPQGQLRLLATAGESCLPSERPVEWPASTPPTGGGLKIVDANGAMVGWWTGSVVLVETDNGWVSLSMDANGPRATRPQLYFDTPCPATGLHAPTDTPHLPSAGSFFQRTAVLDAGRILYPGSDAPGFQPVSMEMQALSNNPPRVCQPYFGSPTEVFAPALTLDISSFVAPFRISR